MDLKKETESGNKLNKYIINIYSYKYIKELLKRVINILLKYTRTVFYTKWYY